MGCENLACNPQQSEGFTGQKEGVPSVLYPATRTTTNWLPVKHFVARHKFTLYRAGCGEVSYDWCGMIRNFVACSGPDHHGARPSRMSCKRLSCPVCFEDACNRAAHRAEDRVQGMKKAWKRAGVRVGRIRHVEWSPAIKEWPRDRVEADGGKSFRKTASAIIRGNSKYYGGALVVHWERKKHTDGTACELKGCRRKHIWVWGPHVHYIGWGFFENSAYVHSQTGWVYKTIDDDGRVRNVFDTVRYQLTHAGLVKRELVVKESTQAVHDQDQVGNAVSYIGMCSMNKGGKVAVGESWETCQCEVCHAELHRYGALNDKLADFGYDQGPVEVRRVLFEFRLSASLQRKLDRWIEGSPGPPDDLAKIGGNT